MNPSESLIYGAYIPAPFFLIVPGTAKSGLKGFMFPSSPMSQMGFRPSGKRSRHSIFEVIA